MWLLLQGTQNFGGIRVGNGPTEDEAGIIEHDQLSQNLEEESPEVREFSFLICMLFSQLAYRITNNFTN